MVQVKPSEKVFRAVNTLIMLFLMLITLYPILFVFFASITDPVLLSKSGGMLFWPQGVQFQGYQMVLDNPEIYIGYANTIFYVLVGTILNVSVTAMLAFALSRKQLLLKKAILGMIVVTMFIGGGMIPTYLIMQDLHLLDTRFAVILPGMVSTMNLIIMRTNFESIPDGLEEAARIDGASDLSIFVKIILPLSTPILAVMFLFYGVGHWNSWFNAMLYLRDRSLYPLQLFLREIIILSSTDNMTSDVGSIQQELSEVVKYATIVIATLPILCVYPFVQKYFVKGVMIGAIKG
ncbi:MAG: carbohydrate ABC transporter permease [Candidatus Merdivicinus sp.]|jgi:putative aldouronate transport system permease protein